MPQNAQKRPLETIICFLIVFLLCLGCRHQTEEEFLDLRGKTYDARNMTGGKWYWNSILFRDDATYRWEWGGILGERMLPKEAYEEGTWVLDPSGDFISSGISGVTLWSAPKLNLFVTKRPDQPEVVGISYAFSIIWDKEAHVLHFYGMRWHERGTVPKVIPLDQEEG